MRENSYYPRLIEYNRRAVFLSFLIILFSVAMFLIMSPDHGVQDFNVRFGPKFLKMLICTHSALCVWSAVDSATFIRVFYKIIIYGIK